MSPQRAEDPVAQVAMAIILAAGDAHVKIRDAYQAVLADPLTAHERLDAAKADVKRAHQAQTEMIQSEAAGDPTRVTLLLAHAQDTLMTVKSELDTAGNVIPAIAALDVRLRVLEGER
jgi:PTS system cellobiose-specific IIA component